MISEKTEVLTGTGELKGPDKAAWGTAAYSLTICQEFRGEGQDETPTLKRLGGVLTDIEQPYKLIDFKATLRMEDGRYVDLKISNIDPERSFASVLGTGTIRECL